jgi:CheY-like chemotaxis protein
MTSPTAEQGILLAEVKIPDIILMDISLPGIDGIAALGVLRRLDSTHRITVIALTAKAMDGDIKAGEEAGFDDYLTKPIDIQHLRSVIVRHISASNLKI